MKNNIITAGCSFTNCGKSWPYHINDRNVYNVGTVGAGNGYISRAAIWECEELLNENVPPEDIFLIVMWSGIDRFEVLSTSDSPLHKDYISGDKDRWWLSNYNQNINEEDSVWLKSSIPDMHWDNRAAIDLFKQHWKYFYTEEESFLKTLEYILRVQNYCEVKKIKYKFCCWQNIFNQYSFKVPSGYAYEGQDMKLDLWTMVWLDGGHWEPDRYWPKEITQKISRDTPLLKDVYSQTTHLWDMIDWDKWWFYEDDQVEYGGLAEWVVLGERHNMGMQHDPAHPSEESHKQFAEKVVEKWIIGTGFSIFRNGSNLGCHYDFNWIDGSLHQLHYINGRYNLQGVDSERFSYDFEESPIVKIYPGQGIYLFFNKGKSILIFCGLDDPIHEYLYLEQRKYMTDLGFSTSDWIVISTNLHENLNYDNWINEPWLQWQCKFDFLKYTPFEWTEDHIKYLKEKERNFNLLSFNRTNKKPREEFIKEIVSRNLWDTSLISAHWPIKGLEDCTPKALDLFSEPSVNHHPDWFLNAEDVGKDGVVTISGNIVDFSIPFELLEDVFFMANCDSHWVGHDDNFLAVSEKCYKVLVSTPFILFGNPGVLKYLKTQGFKTSSHMFDESYDDISDNNERFLFVMNEIEKFCQLSYDEKKEKYIKSFDNILYNQKVLLNKPDLTEIDKEDIDDKWFIHRKYFILEVLKKNKNRGKVD